jgi:PilZ domain
MTAPGSSAEAGVGTPVIVVRTTGNPPPQHAGEIANLGANGLAVRIAGRTQLTPGEPILVVAVSSMPKLAVRARFAASQGELFAFQLDGHWRSLDPRKDTRYGVQLAAEVRSVLGTSKQAGAVADISPGGASVAVAARPGGRQVELSLGVAGYSATLPCEVVGVTETEAAAVLHMRFTELSAAQQAFLRHVIGVVRAASDEDAREMAS